MAHTPRHHHQTQLQSANALTRFLRQRLSISVLVEGATVSRWMIVSAIALFALAFAMVALAEGALGADIPGVSVVQSDNHTLRVVYHTAKRAQTLSHDSDNTQVDEERFLIAIPAGAEAQVGYVKPYGGQKADAILQKTHRLSSEAQSSQALVEIGGRSFVRGWKVASVIVRALQNDTVYDSLEIEIQFVFAAQSPAVSSRPARVAQPGIFGALFAETMLNYAEAHRWADDASVALPLYRSSAAGANPFSQSGNWVKMNVMTSGLVRVNGSDLSSVGISIPASSDNLRLFYDGGEPLSAPNPKNGFFARPTIAELPIKVFDGGDGRFDANDYFIFYGEAANHWRFVADSAPRFIRNVFTDSNYYWLTVQGSFTNPPERITTTAGASGSTATITTGRKVVRVEQDNVTSEDGRGDIDNYYDWFWGKDNVITGSFTAANPSTDASLNLTTRYKVHAIAGALSLQINGQPATTVPNTQNEFWSFSTGALNNGANSFRVDQSKFFSRGPYLDYIEVDYLSDLQYVSGGLDFYAPFSAPVVDFSVTGAPANAFVWRLNDSRRPVEIPVTVTGATAVFSTAMSAGEPNRFFVASLADAKSPTSFERVVTADLRSGVATQTDYIIVTPRTWIDNLQRYVDYRSAASGVTIKVVAVEDIYNEFSGGRIDPSAIRDYLKYAFENSPAPAPSTVLFVGDGSYDFRHVGPGSAENKVPPYIRPSRFERNYISDDSYVYFDDFAFLDSDGNYVPDSVLGVDMVPARWPVRTTAELNRVIDKTIAYETSSELGPWRTKAILLADDEFSSEFVNESVHVLQTEDLEKNHLPQDFLREKIYLWDYPFNSLRERPSVNDALVRAINEGALVFNYVGHGNPQLFAHERVFTTQSDLPRLRNGARLPLVFTASCSIGFFDSPTQEGMAEELLRMNNGAICVVSATRLVYSAANALFNRVAFDHLFGPQDLSIAQAVFAAKLTRQRPDGSVDNDRRYSCFGDPYLRLSRPEYQVRFTDAPDSLVALQLTTISGEVLDASGAPFTTFTGTAQVTVRDSRVVRDHKVLNAQGDVDVDVFYEKSGAELFRTSVPVVNGTFSSSFIPSLDMSFGGSTAQISVYVSNATTDAEGVKDSIPVSATVTSSNDTQGPQITLTLPKRQNFLSGDKIGRDEEIVVRLADPSGINLSGAFAHSITFIVDDDLANQARLTDSFVYDDGSFSAGELHYTISESTPGVHQYKIKAWDNANNSASLSFSAETTLDESIAISDLVNYPNPMTKEEGTSFYFNLQAPARRVTLQIFTVSGAEVYAAEATNVLANYHSEMFPWSGRDYNGARVATGIYLYKVVAYPEDGSDAVEEFGKMVVMN